MQRSVVATLSAFAVLAACTPPQLENTAPAAVPTGAFATVTCDASFYTYLVGEPIEAVYTINPGLPVRILGADEFVTRDFNPNRLTFTTSPDDNVSRVFCG